MARWSRRRTAGAAVLAIWVAVLGWHVRREYFKEAGELLTTGARKLNPGRTFYVVRMGGRAIGMANSQFDTAGATGYEFDDFMTLDVPALDAMHRATVRTRLELGAALELKRFSFDLASEIGRFSAKGEVRGDTALDLEVVAGGGVQKSTLALKEPIVLSAALPLRLAASGQVEPGREYRLSIFDPSILEVREIRVRITGFQRMVVPTDSVVFDKGGRIVPAVYDTVAAWQMEQTLGGVTVSGWVDEDGRIIRAETPMGFSIERTPFEVARDEWRRDQQAPRSASGYGDVIESTAISSNVDLGELGAVDRLSVRLLAADLRGFDLEGGRQRLRGDTLMVRREQLRELRPRYQLPYRGGGEPGKELAATALIQARDPRIVSVARQIAGGEADPLQVALRLNDWVFRQLEKDITLSVPSALQVLEARRGDCNEHTVLYVALARALGLPTRTAVGLVHVRGRFYYHAWPEVWLGEWVAFDPTLGQTPADASHLRFLVGGLAQQVELVRIIGRLKLEVV